MSTLPARMRAVADLLDEVDAPGIGVTVYEHIHRIYLQGDLPGIVALAQHLDVTLRTKQHGNNLYHRGDARLDGHDLSLVAITITDAVTR